MSVHVFSGPRNERRQLIRFADKALGRKIGAAQCKRQPSWLFEQLAADLDAMTERLVEQSAQLADRNVHLWNIDLDLVLQGVRDGALSAAIS